MAADHYVATEDIFVSPGVAAHRRGDVVPASNVESNGWADKVAGPRTKAAKEAKTED